MEELTEVQSIRLGDFKEQLASIKKNIDVANKELEATLEKTHLANEDFLAKQNKIEEIISKLQTQAEELHVHCLSEDTRIKSAQSKLESDIKEFDTYKQKVEKELLDEESNLEMEKKLDQDYLMTLRKDVLSLEKNCDSVLAKSNELLKKKNQLDSDIVKMSAQKKELAKELADSDKNMALALAAGEKEGAKLAKELADLKKKRRDEADKLTVPHESLAAEKTEFEKYKADVRILYSRANRMWSVMYPGQSLEDVLSKQ